MLAMMGYPDFTFAALLRPLIGGMEATGYEEEATLPNETHYDKVRPAPARPRACKSRSLE
jgi:hypothetical protein